MKFIAIPILMVLLVTQTFSKWFTVLSFNLSRDYIAKNLCESRFRPTLACKGNCVLMKKMEEEKRQDQNAPAPVKMETGQAVLSSKSFFDVAQFPVFAFNILHPSAGDGGKPIDRASSIFRPPTA